MFTKNIGTIFFILYLKATILEMSSQLNNANQINNNSISVENEANMDTPKGSNDNLNNVDKGTYSIYLNGRDEAFLYKIVGVNKIFKYALNNFDSKKIKNIIKNNKEIPKFTKIIINDKKYKDHNIKLVVSLNKDDNTKTYNIKSYNIKDKTEKTYPIEVKPSTEKMEEDSKYEIKSFTIHNKNNKQYASITTVDGKNYWVNKKMTLEFIKYFRCEDNQIYCYINKEHKPVKLTIITEDKDMKTITIDGKDDDFEILYLKLRLEIDNKIYTLYINKCDQINYESEHVYKFSTLYIHNSDYTSIYGYEFTEDKYYNLTAQKTIIFGSLDKELYNKIGNMEEVDEYTCIKVNGENKGIVMEIKKDEKEEAKYNTVLTSANLVSIFKTYLDITKLEPYSNYEQEHIMNDGSTTTNQLNDTAYDF